MDVNTRRWWISTTTTKKIETDSWVKKKSQVENEYTDNKIYLYIFCVSPEAMNKRVGAVWSCNNWADCFVRALPNVKL